MESKVLSIVERCVNELVGRFGLEIDDAVDGNTLLFGETGLLDSVGLVSLIVAVEQEVEDDLGATIMLADERAMSQSSSPYRTVETLARYASQLVAEELSGCPPQSL